MNTVDLINKVAVSNNLTTGRAEMIISIITEKITDKLKKDGSVTIENFGTFHAETKKVSGSIFPESLAGSRKYVVFTPDKHFLDIVNS
jgi:nucleoid DNA-binding protein